MAGTGNPQFHRRRNGFLIEPFAIVAGIDAGDGEIFFHPPTDRRSGAGDFAPEIYCAFGVRENDAVHAAATDKAIVPAKIVIQHHGKFSGLAGLQRRERAGLNLGFQTTATERAGDFAVGKKNRLGPGALRAGTFRAGNERQRERLAGSGDKVFVKTRHAQVLARHGNGFNGNLQPSTTLTAAV